MQAAGDSVAGDSVAASTLFAHIEALHGDRSWGSVLDAGTGSGSIRWIQSLSTERWTAVTGAEGHALQVQALAEARRRPADRIVLGNWADPALLAGETYDTVLADYLLGAIDGFAPYFQERLFARLRPLTAGRLYVVGIDPYVPADPPRERAAHIVWRIGRLRDSCLLLAGERPYREYPAEWVVENLRRSGFEPVSAERFPIRFGRRFVEAQIAMCAQRLARLADRALAAALESHAAALRDEALAHVEEAGSLPCGHDYVIAAEPRRA
ncbi:hypothetical protein [Novosphingobium silvae]|jgi:hypothetical protein|uniref:hypothetical protein n=1 Tax=Novosphingobium silvae TaxID=2692619 RepID=UPI0019293D35|nr:hypothetical protein [Novosphingobium silvae]